MKYLNGTVDEYLRDLSARLPAPGGGSAAALVGAVGVACLEMVANYTIGKTGYERYQKEIKRIISKLAKFRVALQRLIDEDVEAYSKLSSAYKLPKEDKTRQAKIKRATKGALKVPFEVLNLCLSSLKLSERLLEIGNRNLITDVGCGATFLRSAIKSAELNIRINLKSLRDGNLEKKLKILISNIDSVEKRIFNDVLRKI